MMLSEHLQEQQTFKSGPVFPIHLVVRLDVYCIYLSDLLVVFYR